MKNLAFSSEKDAYYNEPKPYLCRLVPNGPNVVMDLGCACGHLGKKLLDLNKASEFVSVELFEPAAREAMTCYKRVHVGDIEELALNYSNYFDVVICSDILEHLKDPSKVIGKIDRWCCPKASGEPL